MSRKPKKSNAVNGSPLPAKKKVRVGYKRLKVEHEFPADVPTVFANNFAIQHDDQEFHLLFFQTNPPFIVGEAADIEKQIKELKAVKSQCVARIIVTASKIPQILAHLGENFGKYQAKAQAVAEFDIEQTGTQGAIDG